MAAMTKASMRVGALYASFWVTGVGIVLLGVAIPHMAVAARDDANARHFLCEFLGTLVGSSMVRRGSQAALLRGLALCVAGAMAVAEFRVMVDAKLFVFGVGLGLVISATNLLAGREAEMEQRASRLEILNFYWALGAMMCPWLVGWMLRGFAAAVGFRFVAGMFAVVLVAVWRTGGAGAAATASPERMEGKAREGVGGVLHAGVSAGGSGDFDFELDAESCGPHERQRRRVVDGGGRCSGWEFSRDGWRLRACCTGWGCGSSA